MANDGTASALARNEERPEPLLLERHGNHSDPVRGLVALKRCHATVPAVPEETPFSGRFGRMFPLDPAEFTLAELRALGHAMSADPDPPTDGKDPEESGIPALYTYFGQFVDHDLTFDPNSSFEKQKDVNAKIDYRTPALDLDSLYGRGPNDQPYLYTNPRCGATRFLLGDPLHGGGDPGARDLPRNNADPARALIGDPRNDENCIVSQLHGLFLRFHNRLATENPSLAFQDIQRLVRFHYQHIVLYDFMPRIINSKVLSRYKFPDGSYDRDQVKTFTWDVQPPQFPFMPVEFSVAAYRFGHSMVRPGYRLNDTTLRSVFPTPPFFPEGLTGFQRMNPAFGIDWGRFIDVEPRKGDGSSLDKFKRLQFAYRIDASLANPLAHLPAAIVSNPPASLAERNLRRGYDFGLPSGQAIAESLGEKPLADEEILIGKATQESKKPIRAIDPRFERNCPLWTYILAEAMHHEEPELLPVTEEKSVPTPKLGPVGGRIVAEVILGLLFADKSSVLYQKDWQPTAFADPAKRSDPYTLADFVGFAIGK